MRVVPPRWRWALSERRCPCLCGGEGFLVFIVCPRCAHLSFACDEVGTVFGDVHDTAKGPCGHWLDWSGGYCSNCGLAELSEFRDATLEEIEGAGFSRSDFTDIG